MSGNGRGQVPHWGQPLLWPAHDPHSPPAALWGGTAVRQITMRGPWSHLLLRHKGNGPGKAVPTLPVGQCWSTTEKNLWQPLLEIVPFIVLASETIKFSKLLPKQISNPVNSRACNCLKQIGMYITLKSLLLWKVGQRISLLLLPRLAYLFLISK